MGKARTINWLRWSHRVHLLTQLLNMFRLKYIGSNYVYYSVVTVVSQVFPIRLLYDPDPRDNGEATRSADT